MSNFFYQCLGNDDQYGFMEEWDSAVMDEWVAKNIGLSRCKGEADLFETKWFDYRDMHPLQATAVFTEEYKRQYANIMLTHGREDFQSAPFSTGLKRVPFQDQSAANKTSIWKARQFADRYCVNYGYFIGTVLSIAASRLWDKLPRPQHLWQPELIEIFEGRLKKRALTRLDSSLWGSGCSGVIVQGGNVEIQRDYFEWLLTQIENREPSRRVLIIYSAVWLTELLPEHVALQRFPKETLEARSLN